MKKRMILGFLGLAFFLGLGVADDLVPVAVSPGAENGPAVVRQSCPTFSWTAVSWALTYKVVVFEAGDGESPAYETIATNASPVLVKEIPGKAFSWTPSADEPLLNGGSYVWYVGAMVNAAQGSWSEGRRFIIAESPGWGVVSEPREDGIGGSGSRQVSRDQDTEPAAKAQEKFNLTDDPLSQQMIDIEGTEGSSNTFYGLNAGNATMSGGSNSFFGRYAGNSNTSGYSNAFMGRAAGRLNKKGYENTFLGNQAGYANTTGYSNVSVGSSAGFHNTTGEKNVFVGASAGSANTSGYYNVFNGAFAGNANTDGIDNTFVGCYAGYKNTVGDYNTIIGKSAGEKIISGDENTFVGDFAGYNNISGNRNVFVGNEAGYNEPYSNRLYIHNSSANSPLIYGEFDNFLLNFNAKLRINTSTTITVPTHLLDVGTSGAYCNGAAWVDGSSREYKENIEELTTAEAIQAFAALEPVKFNYKENKDETYLGFIAEDVPDLVAMNDRKGLNPMDMVAMLTKVVQEQQKAAREQMKVVEELKEALASQHNEISELKEKLTRLENTTPEEK